MSSLQINSIKKVLKHRYPFLLIDRVLEVETGVSCVAQKNLTVNEIFFNGHFPENPILPGVLEIEMMAQTAGIAMLGLDNDQTESNFIPALAKIEEVRFRQMVHPGDVLIIYAKITGIKINIGRTECKMFKRSLQGEETLVSEGKITLALQAQS